VPPVKVEIECQRECVKTHSWSVEESLEYILKKF
jgi:hypothetical protein